MILRGLVVGAISIVVLWLAFVMVVFTIRPDGGLARQGMRVLPDTVRLVRRLATDRKLGAGIRLRLWLLLAYLLSPIDLVPDFLPVIGFADDVIILAFVLRGVVRRAGVTAVREHWPGTPEGLQVLGRLCRLELDCPP